MEEQLIHNDAAMEIGFVDEIFIIVQLHATTAPRMFLNGPGRRH